MNKTECGKKHSREWDQRGSKVGMGNKKYRELWLEFKLSPE